MRTTLIAAAAAMLLASVPAFAQPGNGGAKYSDVGSADVKVSDVVPNYVAAAVPLFAAETALLSAVGDQADADRLQTASKGLTNDATRGALDEINTAHMDALAGLEKALAAKPTLDEGARKQYADALRGLGLGLAEYTKMNRDLEPLRKKWRGGGTTTAALYVAKGMPFALKSLGSAAKAAIEYAQANNIPVAPEAQSAVAAL